MNPNPDEPLSGWHPSPNSPTINNSTTDIWRIPIDDGRPAAIVESRRQLLSPDERERSERYYFDIHRNQYILCRGALRLILGRYLDLPPQDIQFDYENHGKPALRPSSAKAPPALRFNVSHSGDLALLGVTCHSRIGVDIEHVRPLSDADGIAERFFSATECADYAALPQEMKPLGFFQCWTRKEAFIKAIGEGLSRPLHSFGVTLTPGEAPRLLRIDGHPGEETRWSTHSFAPAPGYIAAAMIERPGNRLAFYDFAGVTENSSEAP